MKLSSLQLIAFLETAQQQSFTKAASRLNVTQSALSQRISLLEDELETTLFVRESKGLYLTPEGEMLLRHCQVTSSLEEEFLGALKSNKKDFRGSLRVAGFSSVMRSVIIPSLASFIRQNPLLHIDFQIYEMGELYNVLRRAEADYIVLDYDLNKLGIESQLLGQEEYVMIESAKFKTPTDLYLDHNPEDNATISFLAHQGQNGKKIRRCFIGDVYSIIEGVEQGLGRAVMSKHLLNENRKIKVLGGYKKYTRNVSVYFYERPYYTQLHQEVISHLKKNSSLYL